MASRLYDTFGRNDTVTRTPLGISDSGHEWLDRSSVADATGIKANRAWLNPSPALTVAVLNAGVNGSNGLLSCRLVGGGAGLGLYFRFVDTSNWWRVFQRVFTYTYQSGTETYISGYTQVYVGEETYISGYTPTEYLWRLNYPTGVTHGYEDTYGIHYETRWSSSSTINPFSGNTLSHNHYLSGSFYPGDDTPHSHTATSNAYYAGQTRGGSPIYSTRPIYQSQPIYSTRPVYSTAIGYELRVERNIAGSIVSLGPRQITGPFTNLAVVMKGDIIEAFTSGSPDPTRIKDSAHLSSTLHGIGIGKPSENLSAETNFIDDFLFNPDQAGSYQPQILL